MSAQEGLVERLEQLQKDLFFEGRHQMAVTVQNARAELSRFESDKARITSLESELAEMTASRDFQKKKKDEARAGRDENAQGLQHWKAEAARLLNDNATLREALEPFAKHIDEMKFDLDFKGNKLPDDQAVGCVYVTNGDFRRARAALAGHEQAEAERACTCHPDDNPPVPCAEKYAYSECVAAPTMTAEQMREMCAKEAEFWGEPIGSSIAIVIRNLPIAFAPASPGKGGGV